MKTSRAVVFEGTGRPFRCETVEIPALHEGEVLVRNEYTTLCRSDLNTFSGKRTEKTPTILGHEVVGRIEELGAGAPSSDCRGTALRVGDRITWAIYAADPSSPLARRGIPQKAPDLFKYGHEQITPTSHLHGGLAGHCLLRRHTPILRLDEGIPLPVAALINCSVATVAGSLRLAGDVRDRNVLVAGAGMLGVIACAMSRCAGANRVIALDIDAERLETARTFGADLPIQTGPGRPSPAAQLADELPDEPVIVALDYSGVPDTMEALIAALGIGGVLVLVGATYPQRPLSLSAEQMVRRLHTIKGLHNYNQTDFVAAVEFIETQHRRFPFEQLVYDRFSLNQVDEAFDYGLKSGAHRVGIRMTDPVP
ncbi:MAG: zinc-binding dehydrogenase [Verrucomicrobiales bacterium]|nr:zinc-binding dehydrogenase [Verrucomicrobiales bacterium]